MYKTFRLAHELAPRESCTLYSSLPQVLVVWISFYLLQKAWALINSSGLIRNGKKLSVFSVHLSYLCIYICK